MLLGFGLLCVINAKGQSTITEQAEIWYTVDKPPIFPDGMAGFYKYLQQNFKCSAGKAKVKGRVMVQFVVDSTGYVRQGSIKLLKEISPICQERLTETLEKSPKWTAGRVTKLNKDVAVNMVLPIDFK